MPHEEGLVHRDIKPGNLMLSYKRNKSTVKILDFGLARVTREEKVDLRLTSEGQALGTPDYIAPEQIVDATTADIRADIYSLGGTLYHLLTGRPPFQASSLYDMYQAHMSRDADPLNFVRPEVPAELAALVAKMMAKDVGRRFQEPDEVARALTPFFRKAGADARHSIGGESHGGQSERSAKSAAARPVPIGSTTGKGLDQKSSIAQPPAIAQPAAVWESLIEFKEAEGVRQPVHPGALPSRQNPRWLWPCVAAALLLGGLAVAWGVIVRVRTKNADLVVKNVPDQADVSVEGDTLKIKPPRGEPLEIHPDRSGRGVSVKQGNTETSGEEVKVETEGGNVITAKSVPHVRLSPVKDEKSDAGFVPLFNGKDLAGWREDELTNGSRWEVLGSLLVGAARAGTRAGTGVAYHKAVKFRGLSASSPCIIRAWVRTDHAPAFAHRHDDQRIQYPGECGRCPDWQHPQGGQSPVSWADFVGCERGFRSDCVG